MAKRIDMIDVMTKEFVEGNPYNMEYTIKGYCDRCHRKNVKLTKHSKTGQHKPPYILLCRICHDIVHGIHKHGRSLKTN